MCCLFACIRYQQCSTDYNDKRWQGEAIKLSVCKCWRVISSKPYKYNAQLSYGPQIALGYARFFTKRWGMGFGVSGTFYKGEAVDIYSSYHSSAHSTDNWQRAQAYLNFSYTPILRKHWAIGIVQGFGLYHMKRPAYEYSYYGKSYRISSQKDLDTGYNLTIIGRVLLKENVGLFVSANFFHNSDVSGSFYKNTYNYSIGFQTADLGLGVVVNLKK